MMKKIMMMWSLTPMRRMLRMELRVIKGLNLRERGGSKENDTLVKIPTPPPPLSIDPALVPIIEWWVYPRI